MAFDFFQSRRNQNMRCAWWSRNESDDTDVNELVIKRVPSGTFYAEETNAQDTQNNVISGSWMFDKTVVTIRTSDNVQGIKSEDYVRYSGEIWIVTDIQKRRARVQSTEFGNVKRLSHYWYISLRK